MGALVPSESNASLLEALPALYSAASPLAKRGFRLERYAQEEREALERANVSLRDAERSLLDALRSSYPIWSLVLTHPRAAVRLAAVRRVPASGSALSPLLPLFASDSVVSIRQAARLALGFAPKHSWGKATAGMLRARDALQAVARATPEELEPFALDHRTRVRYAVACRLEGASPLWSVLAADGSSRVRRCAAERVLLDSAAAAKLLKDPVQSVRSAIGRRVLKAEEPVQRQEYKVAVEALKQRREAWEKQLTAQETNQEN
jgi:hypothetical protein